MYREGDRLINVQTNEPVKVLRVDRSCELRSYLVQYDDGTTEWLSELDLKK